MKKIGIKIAMALLVTATLALGLRFGWQWWLVERRLETTDDAYVRGDITPISTKVAGYVGTLLIDDNQVVRRGQILLRIEDHEFRLAVAESEAGVASARAALANSAARLARQGSVIAAASAAVVATEAELVRADKDLARARALAKTGSGTRQKLDLAEAQKRQAKARLDQARAQLETARRDVAVLETEKARLGAALSEARARLELARTRLADTVITSPVDGVVGNRNVRLGQYVRPGSLLTAVVPLKTVWIEANYKETQLTHMRAGQPVRIKVDMFRGHRLTGRVASFSPASGAEFSLLPPENATGNFTKLVQRIPVKIVLTGGDDLPGPLRPGMSVVVTVDTRSASVVASDRTSTVQEAAGPVGKRQP